MELKSKKTEKGEGKVLPPTSNDEVASGNRAAQLRSICSK